MTTLSKNFARGKLPRHKSSTQPCNKRIQIYATQGENMSATPTDLFRATDLVQAQGRRCGKPVRQNNIRR